MKHQIFGQSTRHVCLRENLLSMGCMQVLPRLSCQQDYPFRDLEALVNTRKIIHLCMEAITYRNSRHPSTLGVIVHLRSLPNACATAATAAYVDSL